MSEAGRRGKGLRHLIGDVDSVVVANLREKSASKLFVLAVWVLSTAPPNGKRHSLEADVNASVSSLQPLPFGRDALF